MLSEEVCDALVDLFNQKTLTVLGKTFTSTSRRESEMTPAEDGEDADWQPSIIVSFDETKPGIRTQGDVLTQDDETKVVTFGTEEITRVVITVSTKEVVRGSVVIPAKTMASSLLGLANNRVRKKFNTTLAPFNAAIYQKKGIEYENLTKFVQGDGRSLYKIIFEIEHETTWDMIDDDVLEASFGPPTYAIIFTMDTEAETIVQEE